MSTTPTWYDLLDVATDASTDEVRAAWRSQIADLEPGDRRFDALNRAASVLLDPETRASYDAGLESEPEREPAPAGEPSVEGRSGEGQAAGGRSPAGARSGVPGWLLAGLGVLAAVLVATTTWAWSAGAAGEEDSARAAQAAAERAVVPVLSYDYEDLEGGQRRAQALMTGSYRAEYDKLFAVIEDNAPATRTRVDVDVVSSGIVRASDDRVQVLVFVDRPTTNKASAEPVVYKDQVTLSMQRVDGEWLVDDMTTSPVSG
jgi:Mce-associated membrane protein